MLLNWIKNTLRRIAIAKLFVRYRGDRDNWIYDKVKFSLSDLGYNSRKNMSSYMEGNSKIEISNISDLCNVLIRCDYVPFSDLLKKNDTWNSPLTFEKGCKGNCVDSSLWVFRKLIELDFEVEFFVGEWLSNGSPKQHAWIVFQENGKEKLLETVSKDIRKMLYHLDEVRNIYIPWASVDNKFKSRLYGGYCSAIKRDNEWKF